MALKEAPAPTLIDPILEGFDRSGLDEFRAVLGELLGFLH